MQEGALRVHALIDGRFAVSALIVQVIVVVLDARGERRGEEEQAVKVSGILCAEYVGQAIGQAVRGHALVQLQHILVRQAVVRAGEEGLLHLGLQLVVRDVGALLFELGDEGVLGGLHVFLALVDDLVRRAIAATVVALALHLHERAVGVEAVMAVGAEVLVAEAAHVVDVFQLLGDVGVVGLFLEQVAAAAELVGVVKLQREARVDVRLEEGAEA